MTATLKNNGLPMLVELEKRDLYKEIAKLAEKIAKQASSLAEEAKKEKPLAIDVYGGAMEIRDLVGSLERLVMVKPSRHLLRE